LRKRGRVRRVARKRGSAGRARRKRVFAIDSELEELMRVMGEEEMSRYRKEKEVVMVDPNAKPGMARLEGIPGIPTNPEYTSLGRAYARTLDGGEKGETRMHLRWSKRERSRAVELVVQERKSLSEVGLILGRTARGVYGQLWKQGWRGMSTREEQSRQLHNVQRRVDVEIEPTEDLDVVVNESMGRRLAILEGIVANMVHLTTATSDYLVQSGQEPPKRGLLMRLLGKG
jgi:transposase-like protein